jgi:hypothetical protein
MTAEDYWRDWARRLMDLPASDREKELQATDEANRNIVRGLIAELRQQGKSAAVENRSDGPIATPEDAVEAFERLGSDRKAAVELGISRTQLRRLRGVQK